METPKIRAIFVGTYVEKGAWNWRQTPNPPLKPEISGVTAVASKSLAADLLWNVGQLQAGLKNAFTVKGDEIAPRDRSRFIVAILEIVRFLNSVHSPAWLSSEVLALAHALDDLDKGLESPLFRREKVAGNSTDIGEIWRVRSFLAIAADVLIQFGVGKTKAFMQVAEKVEFIDHHVTSGDNFALAVQRWHRIFTQATCPDETAQTMFTNRAEFLDAFKLQDPGINDQALADAVLETAISFAARSADTDGHSKAKALLKRRVGGQTSKPDLKSVRGSKTAT